MGARALLDVHVVIYRGPSTSKNSTLPISCHAIGRDPAAFLAHADRIMSAALQAGNAAVSTQGLACCCMPIVEARGTTTDSAAALGSTSCAARLESCGAAGCRPGWHRACGLPLRGAACAGCGWPRKPTRAARSLAAVICHMHANPAYFYAARRRARSSLHLAPFVNICTFVHETPLGYIRLGLPPIDTVIYR